MMKELDGRASSLFFSLLKILPSLNDMSLQGCVSVDGLVMVISFLFYE
jgi:hypothetical protein